MQRFVEIPVKTRMNGKNGKSENGLHNLVIYYQKLFDKEENINHYSPNDFQNAKRKFVKFSLKNREI
jgi:hypothetical protein